MGAAIPPDIAHSSATDALLRPILQAHAEGRDARWWTILLALLWPGLERIHKLKRSWDPDPDRRWANVYWTFLEVASRFDPERRPERLAQKLLNDTIHHLHDEYRRAWDRESREVATDPEEIDALVANGEGIDFAGIELRDAQQAEIRRLRGHMAAGRISEPDFFLLIGTKVYGRPLAEYAREAGLNYQVAKKRRQRAEATLLRHARRSP